MKAALVGYGYWGKMLERYIVANSDLELVCVYSPELEKNGVYTNNLSEVVNSDEIEVVFIATPVDTHYDLCKTFLSKKKHVFCEKPATKTIDELQELIELADRVERVLYIDYLYMESPSINYIKEHLQEIGEIYRVEGCIEQFGKFYPEDDVYEIIGVHMVSGVLYMLQATEIGQMRFEHHLSSGNGNVIHGATRFVVDDKIHVFVPCNLVSNRKIRTIRICGEKGYFLYDMNGEHSIEKVLYDIETVEAKQQEVEYFDLDEHNTLERVMENFVKKVECRDVILNNTVAVFVQQWLEEVSKSYRSE